MATKDSYHIRVRNTPGFSYLAKASSSQFSCPGWHLAAWHKLQHTKINGLLTENTDHTDRMKVGHETIQFVPSQFNLMLMSTYRAYFTKCAWLMLNIKDKMKLKLLHLEFFMCNFS